MMTVNSGAVDFAQDVHDLIGGHAVLSAPVGSSARMTLEER